MAKKESFAEIYSQWITDHNEDFEIGKRLNQTKPKVEKPTVNEIKKMRVQDELDLHNLKLEQALKLTESFVRSSHEKGLLKIRIITGKGLHSENSRAVIRPAVIEALNRNKLVSYLCTKPKAEDGGTGALIAVLKASL